MSGCRCREDKPPARSFIFTVRTEAERIIRSLQFRHGPRRDGRTRRYHIHHLPYHVKGFSRVLNASGGRSYLEQAARNRTAPSSTQTLQLYGDDNTIAGRFWVTKSVDKNGRYNIISDASGFCLRLPTARPPKEPLSGYILTVITVPNGRMRRTSGVSRKCSSRARSRSMPSVLSPARRSLSSTRQRHARPTIRAAPVR